MKYLGTNRGKVLFIGATAPRGRLIGQVGWRVITPGERLRTHTGHLEMVSLIIRTLCVPENLSEINMTFEIGRRDHRDTLNRCPRRHKQLMSRIAKTGIGVQVAINLESRTVYTWKAAAGGLRR